MRGRLVHVSQGNPLGNPPALVPGARLCVSKYPFPKGSPWETRIRAGSWYTFPKGFPWEVSIRTLLVRVSQGTPLGNPPALVTVHVCVFPNTHFPRDPFGKLGFVRAPRVPISQGNPLGNVFQTRACRFPHGIPWYLEGDSRGAQGDSGRLREAQGTLRETQGTLRHSQKRSGTLSIYT